MFAHVFSLLTKFSANPDPLSTSSTAPQLILFEALFSDYFQTEKSLSAGTISRYATGKRELPIKLVTFYQYFDFGKYSHSLTTQLLPLIRFPADLEGELRALLERNNNTKELASFDPPSQSDIPSLAVLLASCIPVVLLAQRTFRDDTSDESDTPIEESACAADDSFALEEAATLAMLEAREHKLFAYLREHTVGYAKGFYPHRYRIKGNQFVLRPCLANHYRSVLYYDTTMPLHSIHSGIRTFLDYAPEMNYALVLADYPPDVFRRDDPDLFQELIFSGKPVLFVGS